MHLFAVDGLPEIAAGDDLAALIDARVEFEDGDVLCVASTVVSKAEGRSYDYEDFEAGEWSRDIAARLESITGDEKDPRFAQAVIEESEELIVEAPFILAVSTTDWTATAGNSASRSSRSWTNSPARRISSPGRATVGPPPWSCATGSSVSMMVQKICSATRRTISSARHCATGSSDYSIIP